MHRLLALLIGIAGTGTDGGAESVRAFDGHAMARPEPLTPIDWTYPDEARRNNPTGAIVLRCVITREGEVRDCEVLKSLPGVTEWAIEKLKRTRFRPALTDGAPITVSYVFSILLHPSNVPAPKKDVPRWRAAVSPELARSCAGANAHLCRNAALALLTPDGGPANIEAAGRALTAACAGGLGDACTFLDEAFLPPRLISGVPSREISSGPGTEGTVVCRIATEGKAHECQGPGGPVSDWFIARMLESKFLPATYRGTAFETDLGIHYSFRSTK